MKLPERQSTPPLIKQAVVLHLHPVPRLKSEIRRSKAFIRERQYLGFYLTGVLLLMLFLLSLFLEGNERDLLIREGGIVESASWLGYILCAVFMLFKGNVAYLKKYYYLFVYIIFFMLRELDFHTKFTTMGIFKIKFYVSDTVPIMEKFFGVMVILLLLIAGFIMIYRHSKNFFFSLKNKSLVSSGVLIVGFLLGATMILDGISRKLEVLGVHVSNDILIHVNALEEILELGIPVVILLTSHAFFKQRPSNRMHESPASFATGQGFNQ